MDFDYKNTGENIEYRHIRYRQIPKSQFHLHDGFEIYFLISGNINYLIEKNVYAVEYGDLVITNNQELHRVCIQSGKIYERITIVFKPSLTSSLDTSHFDLFHCFTNRAKGEQNKITLNKKQIAGVLSFFYKFEDLDKNPSNSSDILKLAYLIELLVYINKIFDATQSNDFSSNIPNKLKEILNYIDENLDSDLTLDFLKKHFYIDKYYLCKLFKKSLDCSLYEYIICKRISKAKKLILDGYSLTEVSSYCGFNDYSCFYRMFKKHIGLSPAQYKKLNTARLN